MERLWNAVTAVARAAVWCGGVMLLLAAIIVTTEVALRGGVGRLFGSSFLFSGSDEISAYLFAVGTSWSMAYVLVTRGHVRIDAAYGLLPAKVQRWLDLIALVTFAFFIAVLIYRAGNMVFTNYVELARSNTNLRVPLYWAQIPWFAGFALLFLALALAILRAAVALMRGDYATVQAVAGAPSQDEEIESEIKGLGLGSGSRKEA